MGKKRKQPGNWFPEIRVYACTKADEAQRLAIKHTGCDFDDTGKDATTFTYVKGTDLVAVVLVNEFDSSASQIALLAHECSHVVGSFLDNLGEEANDSEFRAYLIQSCMLACLEQLGYGESDK